MSELENQIQIRKEKRDRLLEAGVDPYPARFEHDHEPTAVHAGWGDIPAEELEESPIELRVPGRVRALRKHGKTWFLDLYDGSTKLQVMVRRQALSDAAREILEQTDLGDYLGVSGRLIRTRTGELSLLAADLEVLAKALRPLPEKWHGLADVEARYRQRYLDLLVNPESRRVFEVRAALVRALRSFLDARGFLEVETPMMQPLAGGATARPFVTRHNALDLDLYLRIAPELYLKRLLVGGFHRVYEINRNFRNEGISTRHNPEFTMLEFYQAYADYRSLMDLTEELFGHLAEEVLGTTALPWQGATLELSGPWPRYTVREAITRFGEIPPESLEEADEVAILCRERQAVLPAAVGGEHPVFRATSLEAWRSQGDPVPSGWYGHLLMALFEAVAETELQQPTFVHEFPIEVSPLAKQAEDRRFTERFELYVGGMELANAFSELNDPELQAERFRAQLEARGAGDDEAHRFDEDYVLALEHGMPPAGGEGIGVDRLVMLFTDRPSIRDVILFPLLRPVPAGGE